MKDELNKIIKEETAAIEELLYLLDEQHNCIMKKDVFGMDACVGKLELANKRVAECEYARRQLTKGEAMSKIVDSLNDSELDNNYRKIKRLLEEIRLQKDTNELLIKQGLGFTTKMLCILNPERSTKTYTSYGKMKK